MIVGVRVYNLYTMTIIICDIFLKPDFRCDCTISIIIKKIFDEEKKTSLRVLSECDSMFTGRYISDLNAKTLIEVISS